MHVILFVFCRLQDISSGYWVLVLHFTRREAVRQIDELQHIATNLGRSETSLSYVELLGNEASFKIQRVICRTELFSVVCRSCMVIPGLEWELFRELSASLPGEPRIVTEVLFQVSYLVRCIEFSENLSAVFYAWGCIDIVYSSICGSHVFVVNNWVMKSANFVHW